MNEPNFSESQLQQAVNTAYIRDVLDRRGVWVFANVPSLFDEFDLGWDTAFYFPWLIQQPNSAHEGCNFFLQYKLSYELTSPKAKEWGDWKSAYFRFKIPYSMKDDSGQTIDDHHQWYALKGLADKGYPTFYATNSTLYKDDLRRASNEGRLLDEIPLLDVRKVVGLHRRVTFTQDSPHFLLHSDKEESNKNNFNSIMEGMTQKSKEPFKTSALRLLNVLQEFQADRSSNADTWHTDIDKIKERIGQFPIDSLRPWLTHALVATFVHKHLGVNLLWLPRGI